MQDVGTVVRALLSQMAEEADLPSDAQPLEIIHDSLRQVRFLVGLEEELDVLFDTAELPSFDLSSKQALIRSVLDLVESSATEENQ